MVGTSVMLFRHIHIPPSTQYHPLLMKTINKHPTARQARTCVLTTKASTRLRHSLVPSTPSRFQPSTPLPTHTSYTPPHSHIFITHCKIRHYATAISSIQARFVVMYTFLMQNPRTMNARLIPGFVQEANIYSPLAILCSRLNDATLHQLLAVPSAR